ncbi:MAG: HAD family hydrolase [Actinomycetota bacterium]|nr:HAD family hydrolase [Actinomycetota bacterium]
MSPAPLLYEYDSTAFSRWLVLDRDGTINQDSGYTHAPSELTILPGVISTLAELNAGGWGLLIASNQAGLARGLFTVAQMEDFNQALIDQLAAVGILISGIAVCPHHPDGSVPEWSGICQCRKPETGLFDTLAKSYGLDLERTMFVGNSQIDREAAERAGMLFMWGRNAQDWAEILESFRATA